MHVAVILQSQNFLYLSGIEGQSNMQSSNVILSLFRICCTERFSHIRNSYFLMQQYQTRLKFQVFKIFPSLSTAPGKARISFQLFYQTSIQVQVFLLRLVALNVLCKQILEPPLLFSCTTILIKDRWQKFNHVFCFLAQRKE